MEQIRKEKNVIRAEVTEQSKPLDKLFDMIVGPTASFIFFIHVFYIFIFLGLISVEMKYVNYLNIVVQVFICVILMMRFHPLRKHKLHKHDSQLIFGSAFFLLTNLGITQYAYYASEGTLSMIPGISTLIEKSKKNTTNNTSTDASNNTFGKGSNNPTTNFSKNAGDSGSPAMFGHTMNIDTSGNVITPKTIFGMTMGANGKDTPKNNNLPLQN